MNPAELRVSIESCAFEADPDPCVCGPLVEALLDALEEGAVRAAEPWPDGWRVNGMRRRVWEHFKDAHGFSERRPHSSPTLRGCHCDRVGWHRSTVVVESLARS